MALSSKKNIELYNPSMELDEHDSLDSILLNEPSNKQDSRPTHWIQGFGPTRMNHRESRILDLLNGIHQI